MGRTISGAVDDASVRAADLKTTQIQQKKQPVFRNRREEVGGNASDKKRYNSTRMFEAADSSMKAQVEGERRKKEGGRRKEEGGKQVAGKLINCERGRLQVLGSTDRACHLSPVTHYPLPIPPTCYLSPVTHY